MINGERFRAYVEQFLIPTLKPNDIVVLDNLGSHKGKAVRQAIKAAGARLLFLPKYSPDLNPIEQLFAKFKGHVRKAAPRSLDAVSHAIAEALAQISPAECASYLKNAGYASAQMQNALEDSRVCPPRAPRDRALPGFQAKSRWLASAVLLPAGSQPVRVSSPAHLSFNALNCRLELHHLNSGRARNARRTLPQPRGVADDLGTHNNSPALTPQRQMAFANALELLCASP
jgi:transposase